MSTGLARQEQRQRVVLTIPYPLPKLIVDWLLGHSNFTEGRDLDSEAPLLIAGALVLSS